MNIGLHLTERQRLILDSAASDVMTARLGDFYKYIGDTLRPRREVSDADVRHAACAALLKYGAACRAC